MAEESIEDIAHSQNHYVSHLADVNKTTDVISTEDIFNSKGVLIVRKGARINHGVAEKILRHKLLKPLEDQVGLGDSISKAVLVEDFEKLLVKYQDLQIIHQRNSFEKPFAALVAGMDFNSVLIQKLTVLKLQLPVEYEKSLFCGWLAALICHELKLDGEMTGAAFLAGLFHDIGLLNIAPATLQKTGELTPDEWRAIQSHVVVGKLILGNMQELHPLVSRAVLEHHERCDGSGYPAGRSENELDIMGQVVGMADSMQSIRINQLAPLNRNLRDALPYLHMNSTIHFQQVYAAMCCILKKSGLAPSTVNPFGDYKKYVDNLLARAEKLKKAKLILTPLVNFIEAYRESPCVRKMEKVVLPVSQMLNSSGLLENSLLDWLKSLRSKADRVPIEELAEVELMQNELYWQLRKLHKSINECVSNGREGAKTKNEVKSKLESFADELLRIL
jgi:hypothetical protein